MALVNGVLPGVGGVYISTRSALITIVAVLAAVAITVIARPKKGPHARAGSRTC